MVVGEPPLAQEIGDIAGLAPGIVLPPPVEDPALRVQPMAQRSPGCFLGLRDFRLAGVAEDEEVEVPLVLLPRPLERAPRRFQPGEDPRRVLVVDRHDDRRPGIENDRLIRVQPGGIAPRQPHQEADGRGPERRADPGEADGEQHLDRHLDAGEAVGPEHVGHQVGAGQRGQHHQGEIEAPAPMRLPPQFRSGPVPRL